MIRLLRGLFIVLLLVLAAACASARADAPDDRYYPNSWHHAQIGSEAAWALSGESRSVVVAVVDTGVDADHPDLAGHIVPGWNFNTFSADTSPMSFHGTSVAGVIAATRNNAIGVAGMADVSIMPIIVSPDPGGMSDLDATLGIRWAADHGAKVINISAGLLQGVRFHEAAQYAWERGSLVVVSTANVEDQYFGSGWQEVVTVSASDHDDNRFNSQFGTFLDLLAPGKDIYTTYWEPAGQFQYAIGQGSSFAAPMVSGTAALIWSINPQLSPMEVRNILYSSAHDLGTSGWDMETGWGRLDAGAAAAAAAATVPEPGMIAGAAGLGWLILRRRKNHF
jgi:thermitase